MLRGKALERYPDSTTKGCWDYAYAGFIGAQPGAVLKTDWEQNPEVAQLSQIDQIGTAPLSGSFLVIAGEADQSITFPMLRPLVQKACRNGIALEFRSYPGLDHDPVMDRSTPDQLAWIRDRFAGKPTTNSCPSVLAQ
ncbi:MAG: alpha/beta hydrolase family protein [Steroidobacteraceae bacterium]